MTKVFDSTHQYLTGRDAHYAAFWRGLNDRRRAEIRETWNSIELFASSNANTLMEQHDLASSELQRYFVRVQQREFQYSRVRPDWSMFIRDDDKLHKLLESSYRRLSTFLSSESNIANVSFYGNIKPRASIISKVGRDGQPVKDSKIRPHALDIWDVVRFRIVVRDIAELREAAVRFWEVFFDGITRCRNYYYRPRGTADLDCYRSIHFELADAAGRIVEIQMMTERREAVSLVDHALVFKQSVPFISSGQRRWLLDCSMASNVLDNHAAGVR